ncbi:MAG: DUF4097 family beta strand repeat-containing protein [Terriglobia bacterium]
MQVFKLGSAVLMCCATMTAQQIKVPLSSPGQPATVKVSLMNGSIAVTAGAAGEVVVEASGRAARERADVPTGMHRLDVSSAGVEAREDHNVVSIDGGTYSGSSNLAIQVPPNCSLQLKSMNGGHIEVTGINGEIEASNLNGAVALKNVSGSAVVSSQNGDITVSMDKVTPNKPMSFTTMNGRIDVTIPGDTKARLRLKTDHGEVFSDFDVKMEPDTSKPIVEENRGQGGKYRIRMDKNVYGSINGGGPELRFETMNGSILIHKK